MEIYNKKQIMKTNMNNKEIYIMFILNIIFSFRLLGVFIVLPVLSTYGMQLIGSNVSLIGIAIGIYGLTQIIFQIPYGFASDKIGRKPIIICGLLLSAIGTSIAAMTNTIWGVILGRAIQGASAINAPLIALMSDLIQEKNKTKAMLLLGINFSITFSTAIILGPLLTNIMGLQGLFLGITLLTLLGTILLISYIPSSKMNIIKSSTKIKNIKFLKILTQPQLIKLDLSIFFLHTILILHFITLPIIMSTFQLSAIKQSKTYCINILISLIISGIAILYAEKLKKMKNLLILSIYLLLFSEIILLFVNHNIYHLFFGTLLFFIAFNIIEGILPSILTKETPKIHKGIITAIFSTSQFLGITYGGILGGYLLNIYNNTIIIFSFSTLLTVIWLIIISSLKEPPHIT